MFKIIIKKADNSVYWIDHFNTLAEANKWIAEETTRPYWKNEYTHETFDITPAPRSAEETQSIVDRKAEAMLLKARLKVLSSQNDLTAGELKESMIKSLKLMHLFL